MQLPSLNSTWIRGFSFVFSIILIIYVAHELWSNASDFVNIYNQLSWKAWIGLLICLLGIIPNIAFEAWKWKISLSIIPYQMRFSDAFAAILAGTATGFPTPHKVGEYIGRLYTLPEDLRWEALLATAMDRFCQLSITLLAGSIAWLWIRPSDFWIAVSSLFVAILWIFILLFYSKLDFLLKPLFNRWEKTKKLQEILHRFDFYIVAQLIFLSFCRYLVFSSQYFFLLYIFGNQTSILETYAVICIVYLGKSVLPGVGLAEIGLREALAIHVMAWVGIGSVLAFQATFILYLINSIIPALVGLFWLNKMGQQN